MQMHLSNWCFNGFCIIYCIFTSFTGVALAENNNYAAISIPKDLRGCVLTAVRIGENSIDSSGKIRAFPYNDRSSELKLVESVVVDLSVSEKHKRSCNEFEFLQRNYEIIFEVGEEYPLRIGYYSLSPIYIHIARGEFESGRYSKGYFHLTNAYIFLLRGVEACIMFPSQESNHGEFCNTEAVLETLQKLEVLKVEVVNGFEDEENMNPENLAGFRDLIRQSNDRIREIILSNNFN